MKLLATCIFNASTTTESFSSVHYVLSTSRACRVSASFQCFLLSNFRYTLQPLLILHGLTRSSMKLWVDRYHLPEPIGVICVRYSTNKSLKVLELQPIMMKFLKWLVSHCCHLSPLSFCAPLSFRTPGFPSLCPSATRQFLLTPSGFVSLIFINDNTPCVCYRLKLPNSARCSRRDHLWELMSCWEIPTSRIPL